MPTHTGRSALFVILIIVSAVVTCFISYEYTTDSSAEILDIAAQDSRSNSKIQAHDLSALLTKQIESVAHSVDTVASSAAIRDQEPERGIPLFSASQRSTNELTSAYSWLDRDGKVLWSTLWESNATLQQQYQGSDFSFRPYYSESKTTLEPYFSTAFEAVDGSPRLSISYPIMGTGASPASGGQGPSFQGVVVATIELKNIGQLVQDQLSPDYKSSVGLLDRTGTVLFSSSNRQAVGKSIFDPEMQSQIPAEIRDPFTGFIRDSLTGTSGTMDFASGAQTSTIAYGPVNVFGNDFAILYVVTPHEVAGSAATVVDHLRTLNIIIIAVTGGIAAGLASMVAVWNRRLDREVDQKTSELKHANGQLASTNDQLRIANAKLKEANEDLVVAYEQVEVHNRLQNEFVNVAAHELRTPIQPLLGAAELLETQFGQKEVIEVTRPEIEMILRNAKRLERLSSDILEISRIESGALKLQKEDFSLAYIIADAVRDAKSQAAVDSEALSLTYSPDDIFVYADREKICQVVANLLTNAIKFTSAGTVSIATERDRNSGFATIKVTDTGSGIDSDVLPRLFEKFVTKSEKGTGIGLYISKKIVEAHGGTIAGQNNDGGPGATFKFTVPLARHELEQKGDLDFVT